MRKTYPLTWATPTDHAELADVMFDPAIRTSNAR
jgi:hypothetical protein